jgi:hypothetical protein
MDRIHRYIVAFADDEAIVTLPVASVTVALRFYHDHPADPPLIAGPAIGIVVHQGDNVTASLEGTYTRHFMMMLQDDELPANFSKYIATIPTPEGIKHVVEVHDPEVVADVKLRLEA